MQWSFSLTFAALLALAPSLCSSQELTKTCVTKHGVSNSDSFANVGVEESLDIAAACSTVWSKKSKAYLPAAVKSFKSAKSIDHEVESECRTVTEQGLFHVAQAICSQAYQSTWRAVCCAVAN